MIKASNPKAIEGHSQISPSDFIVGLARGLAIIEAFDEMTPRMTVAHAASKTGLPRSAVRRHLLTLCHLGYLESDAGKLYWLTPRVIRLGRSYLEASRLARKVQPFLQGLSDALGETVNVSVLDGDYVTYLARSNSPRLVSIGFQPGDRAPAHAVAPGVALLSTLSEEACALWIEQHEFIGFTSHTVTRKEAFTAMVSSARTLGYSFLEQQLTTGLTGLAIPLKDFRGQCLGAIGTTFPTSARSRSEITSRMIPTIRAIAEKLREVL